MRIGTGEREWLNCLLVKTDVKNGNEVLGPTQNRDWLLQFWFRWWLGNRTTELFSLERWYLPRVKLWVKPRKLIETTSFCELFCFPPNHIKRSRFVICITALRILFDWLSIWISVSPQNPNERTQLQDT